MDGCVVPQESVHSNPSEYCFVCKVAFDRNLKKSRRRILRDRDDLVSPLLLLLWTAQRTGTWFSQHDMWLSCGPLSQEVTQHLQSMFACRKCFERVIKLERDVRNFETEMTQLLDQSCDTLFDLDIIQGDHETVNNLQAEMKNKLETKKNKTRKVKVKRKGKTLPKKKKVTEQTPPPLPVQHTVQKTKQILLLAKGQDGEQQQLLVLQVPANDNDGEDSQCSHQITPYNPSMDHQYHNDENQAVFLSSNAIPVTTCVTVSSEDQVLEVQMENADDEKQLNEIEKDNEEELTPQENNSEADDETAEAISTIPAEERDWQTGVNDGVIVVNQSQLKRKIESNDESEEVMELCEEDNAANKKKNKKTKESYNKRTYSPRNSSPLPPAGESKVVVQLLYGSKQWKRTMDGDVKSIIRDMALRRPEPAGRKIAASDVLCSAVMKNYSKRLVAECKDAARTIRVSDHQDVTKLDMKWFTAEVFLKCPKTANLVKSLIPVEPRDTLDEHGATALIMGIILYMHSMQSNTLQHILSYMLRRAGCNREGFKALHSLGLTLSYTSILKVMNDIDAKPDIADKSSIDTIEKSIDSVVVRTKSESRSEAKKKSVQMLNQDIASEGNPEPVVLQFTLPYINNGRSSSVTFTTSQLSDSNQTTFTAIPFEANESNVNLFTSQ